MMRGRVMKTRRSMSDQVHPVSPMTWLTAAVMAAVISLAPPDVGANGRSRQARAEIAAEKSAEALPTGYQAEPGLRAVVEAFDTDYTSLRRFYPISGSANRTQRLRQFLDRW